jgi:ribosomal protein L40E
MNTEKLLTSMRCWDCGAENDPGASECWLCHRRDWRASSGDAKPRHTEDLRRATLLALAGRIVVVALALVLLGTLAIAPGLLVPLIAYPVLLVVPIWGAVRLTRGMSPLVRVLGILVMSAVFFVLLVMALFIALFLICRFSGVRF